jgi:CHAT domain-containing protein/tetratricopeptide (TPR) repeat protein
MDRLDQVRALLFSARFTEAEARARVALAATEAASGPDSLPVAHVLDILVDALWRGGNIRGSETKALAERSVAIKETQLGPDDPDVAYSLATLGVVLRLRGEYPAAQSMFERALQVQERSLGPVHPDVARTLSMAATLALDTGDLRGAETLHERALAIRQEALPPGDPAIAESLNGLGVVHERQGDGNGAERYHERALAIREQALGSGHPDVATSLNNLGNVKDDMGDYAAARSLHERGLAIREKALPPDHPDIAMSLNNLAVAIRDLGDHAAAWWPLERVLGIYEQTFGPAHPNVAIATQNLASLLVDLPREEGTRLLAERARRLGADAAERQFLAPSLNDVLGRAADSYEAARALLERALALKERALGLEHTSVAATLTTVASAHVKLRQPDRARPLLERALAIREALLGPGHPSLADTLDPLGELLVETGDYQAAKPTYERELAIIEQTRGADHPRAGLVRQHLAEVLMARGEMAGALEMALAAERIGRDHLRLIGRVLPERDALSYAATRAVGTPVALTILARGEAGPSITTAVWDSIVRSRALVLDEMASRHRAIGAAEGPDVARLVQALTAKREQLARLVVRGQVGTGDAYRIRVERARDERDAAERALAERSLAFRQEQLQGHLGFADVKAALPSGSALVGFVRYVEPSIGTRNVAPRIPAAAYLAFVARAGESSTAVIALGSATGIERDIAEWRHQLTAVAFAGGRSTARMETALRQSGTRLRAKLWDSLTSHLVGASRVFIVPDGPLHLVNWETLPIAGGRYLIEQAPPLHYLSAERDLAPGQPAVAADGLVVIDNPVFNQRSASDPPRTAASFRGPRSTCGDFSSMRFDPLPASAREAAAIVKIWRQAAGDRSNVRLSGPAATEAALKERAAGAKILHLATHAFFLDGRCASAGGRGGDAARDAGAGPHGGENPLLLAGFAFAGANRRDTAAPDTDDGILTAEEVAALDLRGTEWAVLSACDTGVGEILAGEGVLGLRRAFQVAGARTVIMSLWPVDDEDTRRWMTSVYERRVVGGMSTMDAVRDSSLEQLRRRRQAGASTHPFYWGGFIAAGDWR